jgi:phosphate/sulfate permease
MFKLPTLQNVRDNLSNTLSQLRQPAVVGFSATVAAVALPLSASYLGCNVSNEWYTVGASGALGSLAAARYNQHGLPSLKCCKKSEN